MEGKTPKGRVVLRIKEIRDNKGMSLAELAKGTGFTAQYINQLERGLGNPSRNTIALLCDALSCTIEELIVYETDLAAA
jgi:transcriptional regulator with XRE-family HTH domain